MVDRYYDHQEYLARPAAWQMAMESQQLSAERERGGSLLWLLVGVAAVALFSLLLVQGAPFLQHAGKLASEFRRWRRPGRSRPRAYPGQGVPTVQVMRPWDYHGDEPQRALSPGDEDERPARLDRFRLRDGSGR
jgi:hypothetical protein